MNHVWLAGETSVVFPTKELCATCSRRNSVLLEVSGAPPIDQSHSWVSTGPRLVDRAVRFCLYLMTVGVDRDFLPLRQVSQDERGMDQFAEMRCGLGVLDLDI